MDTLPSFETERLLLKQLTKEHVEAYDKYFIDYEVIRNLSEQVPWPYPEEGTGPFLESVVFPNQGKDKWVWGIFLKENESELIGVVDLWRNPCPENRGFWLGRKFWGRGIMTEAVSPIMDYAFNDLGFEKLYFANALGNTRSRRVKEKTGARFIKVYPAKCVDPLFTESELWELSKRDWFASKKS